MASNPEYNKHYNRGWKSSETWSGDGRPPLERADAKGEPSAWYDGYMDSAAGREKFHMRDHHDNGAHCEEHDGPNVFNDRRQ